MTALQCHLDFIEGRPIIPLPVSYKRILSTQFYEYVNRRLINACVRAYAQPEPVRPGQLHVAIIGAGATGTELAAELHRTTRGVVAFGLDKIDPEKDIKITLVEAAKIPFVAFSSPKFDRTRPWTLPFAPFRLFTACIRAMRIVADIRPSMTISAGAFVSVPFAWASSVLRVPTWIHQLDVEPGLANKLMAPFAKRISVTWEESVPAFSSKKTLVVGCMARKSLRLGEKATAREMFGMDAALPTVLVIGGGTGAVQLNEAMVVIGKDLAVRANVLHVTGKGKMHAGLEGISKHYVAQEFLYETMADAYALADVVVARAGMGTIAELAMLGKMVPVICPGIPMDLDFMSLGADYSGIDMLDYVTAASAWCVSGGADGPLGKFVWERLEKDCR